VRALDLAQLRDDRGSTRHHWCMFFSEGPICDIEKSTVREASAVCQAWGRRAR